MQTYKVFCTKVFIQEHEGCLKYSTVLKNVIGPKLQLNREIDIIRTRASEECSVRFKFSFLTRIMPKCKELIKI